MIFVSILFLGWLLGIAGTAYFSVSEISLVTSDKLTLLEHKEQRESEIMPVLQILSDPERIAHTLLTGTVLSSGFSTLFFILLLQQISPAVSLVTSTVLMLCIQLPLLVVLGEIVPRIYYYHRADEAVLQIAKPLSLFLRLFRYVVAILRRLETVTQNLTGRKEPQSNPFVEDEDLEWIRRFAQGRETFHKEEVKIIRKIFDFSDIRVKDILVPIDHVVSVSEESAISQAVEQVLKSGFTRIPVYRDETKKIIGLLHALDILRVQSLQRKVKDFYRKPFFTAGDTLVRELFKSMQERGIMMSVVLDEEGGAQGIVTMEDILEEIFGEIEDEFDLKDQLFREIGDKEYLVDARVNVQELNDQLQLNIPMNGYKTLSGYILHHLDRIPQEGERFTIGSLMFKIELADERKIYKLFIRRLKKV